MLEAIQLSKKFGTVLVTNQLSLRLEPGERHVVLGPNGAGKTTLFNLLAGTLAPDAGEIYFNQQRITDLSVTERARRGLVRSYQRNTLFDGLTIFENLALAASAALRRSGSFLRDSFQDPATCQLVEEVAVQLALTDHLQHPAGKMSYGIRRQLELGLALANRPTLLLMDEPSSGIGPERARGFHDMLRVLPRDLTLLIVEHDMDLAFSIADRLTVLDAGRIVFTGDPEQTRASPLVQRLYLGEMVMGHA